MAKYTLKNIKIGDQLHDLVVAADGEDIAVCCNGRRMTLDQALAEMADKTKALSITEIDQIMEG